MNKEEIIETIKKVNQKVSRDNLNRYIKNHFPEIYNELHELTKELDKFIVPNDKNKQISIFERLYCIEHNLTDRPLCQNCKQHYVNGFDKVKNEYKKWCSAKCQASDRSCIEKSKQSRLEKYGDENYNGKLQAKQTRIKKFGNYHAENFGEKVKKTKLLNFGNENFVNADKAKQTKLEKYGDENFVNPEKAKQTRFEKYGDENYNNREKFKNTIESFSEEKQNDIKNKRKNTNIKLYGYEFVLQNENIKNKTKLTCLEKYGVDSVLKIESIKNKSREKLREKAWNNILNDTLAEPCFDFNFFLENYHPDIKLKWKCKKCGYEYSARYDNGFHLPCPKCFPRTIQGTSLLEQEVVNFLKEQYHKEFYWRELINKRIIPPLELDIYIPDKKLAIEFDGLYWHSEETGKTKNYHLNKTLECEKQGIQLIHIFENEWLTKHDIVKSRLKNLLGIYDKTIYARKCQIKEVDSKISKEFQDENHIQGSTNAKVNLGLYFNDELISLMTFGKCRFDKKHEWELLRFCNKLGYHIPGSASKLLKYFEITYKPKSLVSYADRRWSQGKVYEKLRFTFNHASAPNYWYLKNNNTTKLYSRINFQKYKLKNLLENFDENKTEVENMKANGYNRIFDCGNMVFEKIY